MGSYKKLKMEAEDGNRDAVRLVAEVYRASGNFKMARYYYEKLNLKKEVEEVTRIINVNVHADDDLFS
jgi:hypothetical protein